MTGPLAKINSANISNSREVPQDARAAVSIEVDKKINSIVLADFGKSIKNLLNLNKTRPWATYSARSQERYKFTPAQEEVLNVLVASQGQCANLTRFKPEDIVAALTKNRVVERLVKLANFATVELPRNLQHSQGKFIKQCFDEDVKVFYRRDVRRSDPVIQAEQEKSNDEGAGMPVNAPKNQDELIRSTRIGNHYFYRPIKQP